jgi:tRNA pseudouridine38-40 synthase
MPPQRYFLEVFYKGSNYSGFQVQQNANSIQEEIEKAFRLLQRADVQMTGSSRTDTGVHALQNYFHFDFTGNLHEQFIYKMNAILPPDIGVRHCIPVRADAHSRFDAISREYHYYIYQSKDPFLKDRAYYFPYRLDVEKLSASADIIKEYTDFSSFSKRNSQVKTFLCEIQISEWIFEKDVLIYRVKANRFLRGMVRGLTGTMLQAGRGKCTLDEFRQIILSKDCTKANFAVPGHGLFLSKVEYPQSYFNDQP